MPAKTPAGEPHAVSPAGQWTLPLLNRQPPTRVANLTREHTWAVGAFLSPHAWAADNLGPTYRYGWLKRFYAALGSEKHTRDRPVTYRLEGSTDAYYQASVAAVIKRLAPFARSEAGLDERVATLLTWALSGLYVPSAAGRLGARLNETCEAAYNHEVYESALLKSGPDYLQLPVAKRDLYL